MSARGALFICLGAFLAANVAPAAELPQASDPTFLSAEKALAARQAQVPDPTPPRNVILFIADGMGPAMVTATRLAAGQAQGGPGDNHVLSFEAFPHLALAKTWNLDAQTADSAGTATAMLGGVKARKGVIGMGPGTLRGECATADPVATLGELAVARGLATGIVSTARVTHATPAAFYAHAADRNWEDDSAMPPGSGCTDIARQLIDFPFDVALGGGRASFLPAGRTGIEGSPGRRADGRDLIAEWQAAGPSRAVVQDAAGFEVALGAPPERLLGLFNPAHMAFAADRASDPAGEPTLEQMTRLAIAMLKRSDRGYLLLVEGGLVDPALHLKDLPRALVEGMAFDRAVARAVQMTDPRDTLILVTSDHDHRMPPWAATPRGAAVGKLDTWRAGASPVSGTARPPLSLADFARIALGHPLERGPLGIGSHSPADVAVYGQGPMAHLMSGTVEQTYLFQLIAHALDLLPDP
ncbi:MAG: alkaline phosphatase [Paracoccaceae bacterium]|nr:alkaline phosphatase [Paracoccaceae bacterium]